MLQTLFQLVKTKSATQRELFPDLPVYSRGLPGVTGSPCQADQGCRLCTDACPTEAIEIVPEPNGGRVSLDLGRCIACGGCTAACPTGTLVEDRRTRVAVHRREDLILTNWPVAPPPAPAPLLPGLRRSIHIREVSTGDNASDLEVSAANNPIFDSSRFGIHFVASPRFADALLVTGPVARAMQEPLRRCYDAMAEPRLIIAAGASAISGTPHRGGYAQADGVDAIVPVAAYIPGHPPHPWYILHGILLAMGHPSVR
ncbi:MAG TPA: 4Fe-4S binding protein [Chthonomonadaceae bacterium]|nr:4Fe-4S binding protein [Chthonomonadaceae bacterium]